MSRTAKKKIAIKNNGVLLAEDVDSIDFTGTGVSGSAVDEAIQENIPGEHAASVITYDNIESGLQATNVQDAIDETNLLVIVMAVAL